MKKTTLIALTLVLVASLALQSGNEISFAAGKPVEITIGGEVLTFSEEDGLGVPFVDANGRTQVPVRKPLEAIGAKVDFVEDTREVVIQKDSTEIRIIIDKDMYVNGEKWLTDTSAIIVEDRTYLPIRFPFEALNYSVAWESDVNVDRILINPVAWSKPESGPSTGMGHYEEIALTVVPNGAEFPRFSENDNTLTAAEFNQIFGRSSRVSVASRLTDTAIELENFQFTYEVYRIENGMEKRIYSYSFPVFGGELMAEGFTVCSATLPQWDDSQITKGQYVIKYTSPELFRYTKQNDGQTYELTTEACSNNSLSFAAEVI